MVQNGLESIYIPSVAVKIRQEIVRNLVFHHNGTCPNIKFVVWVKWDLILHV
jgi:hypothetical protein